MPPSWQLLWPECPGADRNQPSDSRVPGVGAGGAGWRCTYTKNHQGNVRRKDGFNPIFQSVPGAVTVEPSCYGALLVALQVVQDPACRNQEAEEQHREPDGLLLG